MWEWVKGCGMYAKIGVGFIFVRDEIRAREGRYESGIRTRAL
jgi:hypothetical protein